jgi:hypothetical protein
MILGRPRARRATYSFTIGHRAFLADLQVGGDFLLGVTHWSDGAGAAHTAVGAGLVAADLIAIPAGLHPQRQADPVAVAAAILVTEADEYLHGDPGS